MAKSPKAPFVSAPPAQAPASAKQPLPAGSHRPVLRAIDRAGISDPRIVKARGK